MGNGRVINKGITISFCSTEEKALLEEIQSFLNKPIEILNINKEDYAATLALSPEATDLKSFIDEHDAWLNSHSNAPNKTAPRLVHMSSQAASYAS